MMKKVIALLATAALMLRPAASVIGADFPPDRGGNFSAEQTYGGNCSEIAYIPIDKLSLSGEWDFALFENAAAAEENLNKPLSDKITVPGAWQLQGYADLEYNQGYSQGNGGGMRPSAPNEGANPTALYKKTFSLTKKQTEEKVYLNLGRGSKATYVYINGQKCGYGEGAFTAQIFDISDFVSEGENEVVVCSISRIENDYEENRVGFELNGLFDDVYISTFGIEADFTTDYDGKNGIVRVASSDWDDAFIAETGTRLTNGENTVKNVTPWSVENPKLYTLCLKKNGKTANLKIGFRRFEAEGTELFLNGEAVKINGLKYQGIDPKTGFSEVDYEADIKIMKDMGVNTVVTDGFPLCEEFYAAADEAGLMVIESLLSASDSIDRERSLSSAQSYIKRAVKNSARHCSVVAWRLYGDIADVETSLKPYIVTDGEISSAKGNFAWLSFCEEGIEANRGLCEFEVTDELNQKTYLADGEIKASRAEQALLSATFDVESLFNPQEPFTVELWGDFQKETAVDFGNGVSIRSYGGRVEFSLQTESETISAAASLYGRNEENNTHLAAVYTGNEIRLFADSGFKENRKAVSAVQAFDKISCKGKLKKMRIYNRALTLDELCSDEISKGNVLALSFDNVKIVKDKSEKYVAYGDESTERSKAALTPYRELLPEGKALSEIYKGISYEETPKNEPAISGEKGTVSVSYAEEAVIVSGESFSVIFNDENLEQYEYMGKKLFAAPVENCFALVKDNELPLSGAYRSVEPAENADYVDIKYEYDFYEDGGFTQIYRVYSDATVSVYNNIYARGVSFCGNIFCMEGDGVSEYTGYPESTYPWLVYGKNEAGTENIAQKKCPYVAPAEFGNHYLCSYAKVETPQSGIVIRGSFDFNALPHSFDSYNAAQNLYELVGQGKTYVRVGRAVEKGKALTAASAYSFAPSQMGDVLSHGLITSVKIGSEEVEGISPLNQNYTLSESGGEIEVKALEGVETSVNMVDEYNCIIEATYRGQTQKMHICFTEKENYISDLPTIGEKGEILRDKSFGGGKISVMGDRWSGEEDKEYEKGICINGNGELVYDVSQFKHHVISFVAARDFSSAFSGRGGWEAFGKEGNVFVYGDGKLIAEAQRLSMRNPSKELQIDISDISELKITVEGQCEILLADGCICGDDLKIYYLEKTSDGKYRAYIGNPTAKAVTPMVYTQDKNGAVVAKKLCKGEVKEFEISQGNEIFMLNPITAKIIKLSE